MALRQANSVSSICTSLSGFTSSSITLIPTLLMSRSWFLPSVENDITKTHGYTVPYSKKRLSPVSGIAKFFLCTSIPTHQHAVLLTQNINAGLSQLATPRHRAKMSQQSLELHVELKNNRNTMLAKLREYEINISDCYESCKLSLLQLSFNHKQKQNGQKIPKHL